MEDLEKSLPPVLSITKLKELSGDSRTTIFRKVREGKFTAIRDGGRTKIITSSWCNYIKALPKSGSKI